MKKIRSALSLLCIISLLAGLFGGLAPRVRAADPWVNRADVSWIDSSKKLVAFTFDDGPVGTAPGVSSQRILDVMEQYGMHCTYFYVGQNITDANRAEIERAYSLGCEIGSHTFTHSYLTRMNQSQIADEVRRTNDLLQPISGNAVTVIRPPYGSTNNTVTSSVNAPLINWSLDSGDWDNGSYNSVVTKIRNNVTDGDIILFHETYDFTAQAVETLVPELIEKGFVIVSVSELMKMKGITMQVGTVYTNQARNRANSYTPTPAETVQAQIKAIGEVGPDSEAAIAGARAAYDALTEAEQAQVANYAVLIAAEAALAELKAAAADRAAAQTVEERIAAIGEVTPEREAEIAAARAAYDALTEAQKALVGNFAVLVAAESGLEYLNLSAAGAVNTLIAQIRITIGGATVLSEAAIASARAAYDALTDVQKAMVQNYGDLTAAEAELEKQAADKAAAQAVAALIDAIGTVTMESEAAIGAARTAYDALTPDQKHLVENDASLIAAELALEELKNPIPFTDVSGWYEDAVRYVYRNKLMNGIAETVFSPDSSLTRAQLVTILYRVAGKPVDFRGVFTDVPAGQWYSDAIEWAADNGIVNGVGDGRFNPDGKITREQIATILHRFSYSPKAGGNLYAFPDHAKVSDYAVEAMKWAVEKGLINGVKSGDVTTLSPQANATRAQIAAIIMRFLEA